MEDKYRILNHAQLVKHNRNLENISAALDAVALHLKLKRGRDDFMCAAIIFSIAILIITVALRGA